MVHMMLSNFEAFVEPKIKDRGYSYYRQGDIKVEKVGDSEFSAVAFGTEVYGIYIRLDGETIVENECDCPYDWGDVCKHVVAALYQIRDGNYQDAAGKITAILNQLSADALREFVTDLVKKDRQFRRRFLRKFDADFVEEDEFEGYDY